MGINSVSPKRRKFVTAISLLLFSTLQALTQTSRPAAAYPDHLPYAFSNFVWWSDADLRAQLKKRIPTLGDEIAPARAAESRVRDALKSFLLQKGIAADIISEEPSLSSLTGERVPGAPGPAVVFSILNPPILVDHAVVNGAPESAVAALTETLQRQHGREYSDWNGWSIRSDAERELQRTGYFDAHTQISHDVPRREGDHYVVDLALSITPGSQYHIGEVTGDGGPLLRGHDLSSAFKVKPGDAAIGSAWGSFGGQLRAFYTHFGYADVVVHGEPILDREHALVSYHLSVTPGPQYHLRSLTINNLTSGQESKVRRLLALGLGDPFDESAIGNLYRQVDADSSLSIYTFGFSPRKDQAAGVVDLILNFSLKSDQPRVIVH